MNEQRSLFEEADIVYAYSRAQAIADGVLVDVSDKAREAGISFPVAITAGLWNGYIVPAEASSLHCQSITGRLWDTLWLFRCAAKGFSGDTLFFDVAYAVTGRRVATVKLKAVCGPGDATEPVITIMLPDED